VVSEPEPYGCGRTWCDCSAREPGDYCKHLLRDPLKLAAAVDREALYQARITHTRMLPPITLTTGIVS
jgi:hypothetical protein